MTKFRFCYNQIGLWVEQFIHGHWRGCSPIFQPENYGGIENLKSELILEIERLTQGKYKIIPRGDYNDGLGRTVTCV